MSIDNKIDEVYELITDKATYNKGKSDAHGEVFTPYELVEEMLDKMPSSVWSNPNKTFFDPAAGLGQFPICIVKRLFKGLKSKIPNETARLKHIVEKQLFMCEFQLKSARFLNDNFKFGYAIKPNIYKGDTLKMPKDFFTLNHPARLAKYSKHCIK